MAYCFLCNLGKEVKQKKQIQNDEQYYTYLVYFGDYMYAPLCELHKTISELEQKQIYVEYRKKQKAEQDDGHTVTSRKEV